MAWLTALGLAILLAVLPPGGTFVDDDGNVHEGGIEAIAAAGITQGCNPPANDRYCPDRVVTRGQMAAFLSRALHLPATTTDHFNDDNGHLFEKAINQLATAGITQGCNPPANNHFCPDRDMTRGQMAAMLARAFHYPPSTFDRFTDDNGHLFENAIQAIAAQGVTVGCNPPANTHFCPDQKVTRDQMATFLTRALGLTPNRPP
ncbi:MAG: S-layer homology domain-containing protein, partial [Acidimicrobiia bacterium]